MEIILGDKTIDAQSITNDWAIALITTGVIVRLNLKRWRAITRLTPEVLGLKFVDDSSYEAANKYISLGTQKLIPPSIENKITRIETMSRNNLAEHSFDTVWGRFVPFSAFESWEEANDRIRDEYLIMGKVVADQRSMILNEVQNDYRNIARDVWNRLYPSSGRPTDSFVENFALNVSNKIPSAQEIISSFSYNIVYLTIPMPSFVEENIFEANKIKLESEKIEHEAVLEMRTKEKVKQQYLERKKEIVDGFLQATVFNLRESIKELCDSVLASISRNHDKLNKKHISKIHSLIRKVGTLNFYNDEEISSLINDLNLELNKFKGDRNDEIVIEKLKKIIDEAKRDIAPEQMSATISKLRL